MKACFPRRWLNVALNICAALGQLSSDRIIVLSLAAHAPVTLARLRGDRAAKYLLNKSNVTLKSSYSIVVNSSGLSNYVRKYYSSTVCNEVFELKSD